MLKIVNRTVPMALARLGYSEAQRQAILEYIDSAETIEGAPGLRDEHLPVFDCAFRPVNGQRSIHWMGHIRMMGAVQPFLSGAISKTVNLPAEASVDDVKQAYVEGWRLGLKALAVYRDGSKRTQPLNTGKDKEEAKGAKVVNLAERRAVRMKLPDERRSITHKFSIAGHEGYLTVGLYENGQPGEIFLKMAKEGSTISGLMDTIATMTSIALQYGVPPKALVDKFSHMRFEPSGFTNNPQIPMAKSIMDYVFRWLGNRFVEEEALPDEQDSGTESVGLVAIAGGSGSALDRTALEKRAFVNHADAPACSECGTITVRNGACYKCPNCGATSGCS
jgi:ribonucleoside-diphosphate reductase alpha chain